MNVFILDEKTKARIAEVIEYAHAHIFTIDDMLDRYNGDLKSPGDFDEFVVNIPWDYRVVFTIETDFDNKHVRHLSVSVSTPEKLPAIVVVEEILKLFGFREGIINCTGTLEVIGDNHQAVSLVQFIDD